MPIALDEVPSRGSQGASAGRRRVRIPGAVLLAALFSSAAVAQSPPGTTAQQALAPSESSQVKGVLLADRPDDTVFLAVEAIDDGSIGLFVSSMAPRCRAPEDVFDLPVQVDRAGFQLKHVIRQQHTQSNGACVESIATVYQAEHYWPLKTATAVTLHLPWGAVALNDAALAHLKSITPARPPVTLPDDAATYTALLDQLTELLAAGRNQEARAAAEKVLPYFARRPPDEGGRFFGILGTARRRTSDLSLAAASFEVAIRLLEIAGDTLSLGVVSDNLATVRRLQKRLPEAEAASDRAIAAFESLDTPSGKASLGGAYNNRSLILADQGSAELALVYNERALALLKIAYKDDPQALRPFLEDNKFLRKAIKKP